jgi:SPP1 family phage portal protein
MPVIYYSHDEVIYEGVQSLIERYELLLSNFADSNDYNGSPILFGNGEITGYADKGEQGKFVLGEGDADLKYVSNNSVSESVKLELETIKNLIFTLTLTPELSFDIMVNLGNVSGLAMDRILTGAHLKAKKIQKGAYGEGIQRRLNFIVSALSSIFPELENGKDLYITPQFNLFRISTEYEKITSMLLANGNLPLIDHETSIEETGLVEDPEQAMILIDKKMKEASINLKNNNANNSTKNF